MQEFSVFKAVNVFSIFSENLDAVQFFKNLSFVVTTLDFPMRE